MGTTVYRVETKARLTEYGLGCGPFQAPNYGWPTARDCGCRPADRCTHLRVDIDAHGNPCWGRTFPELFLDPEEDLGGWVSCTLTLADLRRWFDADECASLADNGFTISVYDAAEVRVATRQAIAYAPAGLRLLHQVSCVSLHTPQRRASWWRRRH